MQEFRTNKGKEGGAVRLEVGHEAGRTAETGAEGLGLFCGPSSRAGLILGLASGYRVPRGPTRAGAGLEVQLESKAKLTKSSSISSMSRLMVRVTSRPRSRP